MMLVWLILAVAVAVWIIDGGAERLLRGRSTGLPDADVARLREELDLLASRVERLDEEQRFLVRLLSDDERRLLLDRGETPPTPPEPPER